VPDQRGQRLRAALGFATLPLPSYDRSLHALRAWLDSWASIGRIAVGMARQGFDLQLTRYDGKGWRATFYTTGMEHSPTSATGSAWERTPWRAVQTHTSVGPSLFRDTRKAREPFSPAHYSSPRRVLEAVAPVSVKGNGAALSELRGRSVFPDSPGDERSGSQIVCFGGVSALRTLRGRTPFVEATDRAF